MGYEGPKKGFLDVLKLEATKFKAEGFDFQVSFRVAGVSGYLQPPL